jgi:hypothetical protein
MRLSRTKETVKHWLAKAKDVGKGDQDGLWPLVKAALEIGTQARKPFEQRWVIDLAFLAGRQYTFFNRSAHALQQIRTVKGRIRNVDNQLLPRWRRQVADLIKNDPIMSVVPHSTDDEDINAAKVANKVLQAWWRNIEMRKNVRELAGWVYSTGNCFLGDRWNPSLGPASLDPKTGEMVYLGDADIDVWSPFDIVVPFTAMGNTNLHRFPWMQTVKWRHLEWIAAKYERGGEVRNESLSSPVVDMGLLLGSPGATATTEIEGAMLINHYIQPDKQFPKGLFIVAANGVVLETADYPFNFYPFEQFKDVDVPGVFWGKSTLEEGIGLQKTWNRTISSMNEFNRTMGKGKGLVPRNANLDALPDDTHGEWLAYTPVMGLKPEILDLKGLPASYDKILALTQMSFDNLFSQHEVSRGTNKSDIRSGIMVAALREQDAQGSIPAHAVFEESLERIMSRILKRIQVGYGVSRIIQVTGREDEFEVFAFVGADLRNNTDVRVKRQSSLPDSRVAREDQILRRFEVGLYGDPQDPEVRRHIMNMLDDAVVKDIYSDTRLDEAYARFENQTLASGQVDKVMPNSYDDHGIHLREHNHFRKGMDYQKIKFQNPKAFLAMEKRFEEHGFWHSQFLEEAIRNQLEMRAQIEGKLTKIGEGKKGGGKREAKRERPRAG